MILFPSPTTIRIRALLWVVLLTVPSLATSQSDDRATPPEREPETLPRNEMLKDLEIQVWGPWRQTAERDYRFDGKVTIIWREQQIQADRLTLTDGRYIEATGNILVVWEGNRISGARLTYDLDAERGMIEKAIGQVQGDFLFWAKRAEKIGDRTVKLESATVTTCTQPVPYWSFSVTSATVTIERYARMWNVVARASSVPFFYSPYLIWPVKQDRSLGLLLPEFGTNEKLGQTISLPLFIPIGRSADVTLFGEYFTDAGFGMGGDFRMIPNRRGAARLQGFYIDDQVSTDTTGELIGDRYNLVYQQTQEFTNGFRMTADINAVSDFNYYTDYERELNLISTPQILQRVEFSRNSSWTSINARELRREQLFADGSTLLQTTLPELEFRGRSNRLGKSPVYLQYEASAASILQREDDVSGRPPFRAEYLRGDLFPTVSLPWSPTPWLDVTPRAFYRFTYYTERQTMTSNPFNPAGPSVRSTLDQDLIRNLWGANLLLVGPKLARIYGQPNRRQFKHAIEGRVTYGYEDSFARADEIIRFDEVDVFNGAGNAMRYSIAQRLFVKRPRAAETIVIDSNEAIVLPDGTVSSTDPSAPPAPEPSDAPPPPNEAVEVANLEIGQSRSFDQDLSTADLDRDGVVEATSPYSSVGITARYNPDATTTVDLRGDYDILWKQFSGATLSGGIRRQLAQVRFSLVHRNGLGVDAATLAPNTDDTQFRLTTGLSFWRGKFRLLLDGTVDFDPQPGQDTVPSRAWRLEYSTQCCTVYLESLDRTYTGSEREDFRFRVDLKGIGKILQVTY
ncbi:MAG TPA: LPS assembly protein LptD [Candidatus Polarisedimenticolaceae bacterium]|nr:LPS assembly protein LptD [Candidatus Polarisedimenticolaceae bacterium]